MKAPTMPTMIFPIKPKPAPFMIMPASQPAIAPTISRMISPSSVIVSPPCPRRCRPWRTAVPLDNLKAGSPSIRPEPIVNSAVDGAVTAGCPELQCNQHQRDQRCGEPDVRFCVREAEKQRGDGCRPGDMDRQKPAREREAEQEGDGDREHDRVVDIEVGRREQRG